MRNEPNINGVAWLAAISSSAFYASLVLVLLAANPVSASTRPNIVLLLADDWGFTDVGAYGSEIDTPHIDSLAKQGVRFSNFHVTASCSPSRAMLMTGVDNHRNGVGNMPETIPRSHKGEPGYLGVLDTNVVTVASRLRDSGYRTYVAGKWHLGKETHNLPPARGFDRSLIMADSGSDNWETAKRYLDISDKVNWLEDGREAQMPKEFYSSKFYVDKTIEYLRSDKASDQPFFAYVAFQANHIPVQAPKTFIEKYAGRYDKGWGALREARRKKASELGLVPADAAMVTMKTTTDWQILDGDAKAYQARRMEVYAGMAEAMDHHIGRLLAYLKETGQFDNTVFVFLSDNGAEASDPYSVAVGRWWLDSQYSRELDDLGAKGAYSIIGPSWSSAAAAPLATYKFYAGEGGLRVPLIIAGVPGMLKNQIHASLSHVNDIVPTLLQLADIPAPDGRYRGSPVQALTGKSLLPVMMGLAQDVHAADEVIGYELSGNQAVFKGDLKLVRNIEPVGDGQWHLYDIRRDPGETIDLQVPRAAEFQALKADYAAYAKANGVLPMPSGYDPIKQVIINAFFNVYVPRYRVPAILLFIVILVLAIAVIAHRRRRIAKAN